MRGRRLVAIMSTCTVAIVLMITLPLAQLAMAAPPTKTCCCLHPEQCHCPDHQPPRADTEALHPCRDLPPTSASQELPVFAPPVRAPIAAAPCVISTLSFHLPAPHAPPLLDERAAPS